MRTYPKSSALQAEPNIRSPKRKKPTEELERVWYEYHAGFSAGFVEDVLGHLHLPPASIVLDPWNGTGITTCVAQKRGYQAVGIDLSPVMVLVAKARHLEAETLSDVKGLAADIVALAERLEETTQTSEPLVCWFVPESALIFRSLERAVCTLLVSDKLDTPLFSLDSYAGVSGLAAFFYVALFRALRQTLISFTTSNPTWIKTPKSDDEKLSIKRIDLVHAFIREVGIMAAALQNSHSQPTYHENFTARIELGTSVSLPLETGNIGAIVSSPPYCTRIDYAIATLPELYLLGCNAEALKLLRDQMIGTPTMSRNGNKDSVLKQLHRWGKTAAEFLNAVLQHSSKASTTYYLRYFLQYFDSVESSLKEISRVLEVGSPCVLVVQDSHYKEVRLDLASIFSEIAGNFSLRVEDQLDYPNGSSLARINKGARKYREKLNAVESVLILRRQ